MTGITQADPASMEGYATEPQARAKILRAREEISEILLKQFCREVAPSQIKVRYHVRKGDPFENILEGAEDFLIDLIVLATHGRTGIKRLVIGNVAEKIVRHAPCPVLRSSLSRDSHRDAVNEKRMCEGFNSGERLFDR